MSVQPAPTTTKDFRQMLHSGEGQPTREFATLEARRIMMEAYNASKSTREACQVYNEVMRLYGYEPLDLEEGEDQ